jgi:hypothetical protein
MLKPPWVVPEDETGRERLEALIEEYEASGSLRELGITLTRYGALVKQIGTRDGEPPAIVAVSQLGSRAAEILRQTDDKKALAAALRVAAQPFVTGVDREALLQEARSISTEYEDWSGVGWVILALDGFETPDGGAAAAAREYFVKAGDHYGIAVVDVRAGVHAEDRGAGHRQILVLDCLCGTYENIPST